MIPRNARQAASGALTATPRGADLSPFTPDEPVGGWTPATVFDAAVAYATGVPESIRLSHRRLVLAAERALYAALPSSVKRAEVVERLRGVDRHRDYFDGACDSVEEAPF